MPALPWTMAVMSASEPMTASLVRSACKAAGRLEFWPHGTCGEFEAGQFGRRDARSP